MVKLLKSIGAGRTMIIIDHDMDSLFELVERVTVLQEGRVLVEGTPGEIKGQRGRSRSLSWRSARGMSLLEVSGLNTYYGDSHILFDVALNVERNEVVALLGRNGAGKSTTLKSLMGVVTPRAGSILFDGAEIAGRKSHAIAQAGMQLVHEERRIFGSLNVEENLVLAGLTAPNGGRSSASTKYSRGSRSGGPAAAPTSPAANNRCWRSHERWFASRKSCCSTSRSKDSLRSSCAICSPPAATLAEAGQTILVVEQNISAAMALADRVYIINNGHIVGLLAAAGGPRTARGLAPPSRRVISQSEICRSAKATQYSAEPQTFIFFILLRLCFNIEFIPCALAYSLLAEALGMFEGQAGNVHVIADLQD